MNFLLNNYTPLNIPLYIFVLCCLIFFIIFKASIFRIFLNFKIKNKIAFFSIVQFLFAVIVIGVIMNILMVRVLEEGIKNNLLGVAESRTSHIEAYFEQNIERLEMFTSKTSLRESMTKYQKDGKKSELDNINQNLKDQKEPIKGIESLSVINLEGKVIASTDEYFLNKDFLNEGFFKKGKLREGVYFVKVEDNYKIFTTGPMYVDGELAGIGLTIANLDVLEGIVYNRAGLAQTGEVLVAFYSEQGGREYLFYRLFEEGALGVSEESEYTALPMKEALKGINSFFSDSLDYRDVPVFAVSTYIEVVKLGLVTKIDKAEVYKSAELISLLFALVSFLLVILYYFVSSKTSAIISRPIDKLREGLKKIKDGNLDYKVSMQGNDEIAEFSRAFDGLTRSIKKSRLEVDEKVKQQTFEIEKKAKEIENQQSAVLNILEDVEKDKIKAERLAKDLKKFELAVEYASDHIIITDVEGVILHANQAVEKITGFKKEEILGLKVGTKKTWGGLMGVDFYEKMWKKIKKDKKIFTGVLKNKRKNGEEYEAYASIAPVLDKNKNVLFFVGIERDVTKEKEIDKVKTEFVSLASHQLRTPLSTINWYVEMLLSGDAGKITKKQQKYLNEIERGNKRMVDLVNALLNVSRLELGTFIIEPEMTDITKLSDIAIEELAHKISVKKIKIIKKYDRKLKKLKLDKKLTLIIFQNLLSNAIKYTPNKGKVTLEIKKYLKSIKITVKDTGMGIPDRQQDRMFTKLFRADNVKVQDTEGTGLGMYIVKSIIDSVNGKISFLSKENKGTTFTILIPATGMKKRKGSKELN